MEKQIITRYHFLGLYLFFAHIFYALHADLRFSHYRILYPIANPIAGVKGDRPVPYSQLVEWMWPSKAPGAGMAPLPLSSAPDQAELLGVFSVFLSK